MSLPAFKFYVHAGIFTGFVEGLRVHSLKTNGMPEPPFVCDRPAIKAIDEMAALNAHRLQLHWTIPYDLLDALMDVLAWWMANTKAGALTDADEFAFDLLESAREWRRRSIVDHISEIRHE